MVLISSGGARGALLRIGLPGLPRPAAGAIVRNAMTFEDVVREHQDDVYGAALRILGDRDAALDAANQAFLKAYRSLGSYDPSRPIRPWLLRIAVNEAITIGRARTRERGRSAPEAVAAALPDRA
ncbi:MAG: polymerase sigma-70 factor, subfamily, partial [Chloroflexota bacterium]|nr:polymerase sigma-70 factor, subfamily [Chloroflexota bacterium]